VNLADHLAKLPGHGVQALGGDGRLPLDPLE
jgi:hypothetical protein